MNNSASVIERPTETCKVKVTDIDARERQAVSTGRKIEANGIGRAERTSRHTSGGSSGIGDINDPRTTRCKICYRICVPYSTSTSNRNVSCTEGQLACVGSAATKSSGSQRVVVKVKCAAIERKGVRRRHGI